MQTLTAEVSQKQSAAFIKIQGQTYQVIDDADWIGFILRCLSKNSLPYLEAMTVRNVVLLLCEHLK